MQEDFYNTTDTVEQEVKKEVITEYVKEDAITKDVKEVSIPDTIKELEKIQKKAIKTLETKVFELHTIEEKYKQKEEDLKAEKALTKETLKKEIKELKDSFKKNESELSKQRLQLINI